MRKLDSKYENPIVNFIYIIVEYISPFHHKIGLTPNILTTISLIIGIVSSYFIYKKQFYLGSFLYLIAYIYDCLDGYNARKYDMVTKFGDYYDHLSDLFKSILYFYVLYKLNKKLFYKIIPISILFMILLIIHLACQEVIYEQAQSPTLELGNLLCKNGKEDAENKIKYTRYFGAGTFTILSIIIILIYKYNNM